MTYNAFLDCQNLLSVSFYDEMELVAGGFYQNKSIKNVYFEKMPVLLSADFFAVDNIWFTALDAAVPAIDCWSV